MKIIINIKNLFVSNIGLLLLAGLALRFLIHPFGTLQLDHGTFVAWSNIVVEGGLKAFYSGWSDYLPGYVYVLWLLGHVNQVLHISTLFLYKLPAIMGDLAAGALIYQITRKLDLPSKNREKFALLAAAFYIFNPAIFANSTMWGQVDTLTSLFSLLAVYLASYNPIGAAISLAIGTIVKPQAALALIPVLFVAYKNKWKIRDLFVFGLAGFGAFCLMFLPFTNLYDLPAFIVERLNTTLNQYKYTSVNAFSFWGLGGFWKPDEGQHIIGWIVTAIVPLFSAWKLRKVKDSQYLLLAITLLTGFLFMTRMHERHMLPVLAPLIVATTQYPQLLFAYIIMSFTYVANLYYAFIWITQNFKEVFSPWQQKLFIILNLISFGSIILTAVRNWQVKFKFEGKIFSHFKAAKDVSPKLLDEISRHKARSFLILILIVAAITRFFMLYNPPNEYFDEVYHAFTARTLLHGDPKGWEWWNPNPENFAYEWTHPPLAKHMMIIGMTIFGENAFGWRIPSATLGVGCVYLVYLIAKKLFDREEIGLLSAFIFAMDGLPLVMSRIGMNDTYFLFSVLLSFWLYLSNKNLLSALFLGFAAASKWSTMWFLPILVVTHFALRRKIRPNYIWFFVLPPLVYLATYIPFFTSGHNWDQFIELQKQMWWYHTGLVAEHGYSSSWWSWPVLARPIWLFVERPSEMAVANIYAMGNPIIFWTGFVSAIASAWWAIKERNRKLGLIVFAYIAFFATWAISPRIMFLYHYLPSVPFMAILTGYTLRRNKWLIMPILITAGVVFVYYYPHWTGILIPEWLDRSYYWFPSWR